MLKSLLKSLAVMSLSVFLAVSVMEFPKKKRDRVFAKADNLIYRLRLPFGGAGTGFKVLYNNENYIITNEHVCGKPGGQINVELEAAEKRETYPAKVLYISSEHDLCIIESDRPEDALKINPHPLERRSKIYLIGHPLAQAKRFKEGMFLEEKDARFRWIHPSKKVIYGEMDIVGAPGNSGSPILNEDGDVVGVLFSGVPGYPSHVNMVPSRYIVSMIEEYKKSIAPETIIEKELKGIKKELKDLKKKKEEEEKKKKKKEKEAPKVEGPPKSDNIHNKELPPQPMNYDPIRTKICKILSPQK